MNILEEIQNCPVEWKELGEVCDTVTDFTAAGSFASNAKNVKYIQEASFAQLIRTTDLKSGFKGNNFVYVDEHAFNYLYRVNLDKESLIMPNVGNCGEIYYIKPENLPYENNVLGPNALLVRSSKENNRYLFHLFQSGQFQNKLAKITSNTGQTKYNKTNLKKIRIPIPPLETQEKIVQILDKMTEYVTELTSELTSRKKQYSFYRDKLLSFEDEVYQVEWMTLGDIGKVSMCRRILKNQTSDDGEIPFYKIGTFGRVATSYISRELFEDYKLRFSYPKLGDILISASGTIGRTVVFNGEDSYFQDSNIVWLDHDESQVLNRYLYYFYQINPWNVSDGGTISRLYNGNIEKTRIPVPSLEIQSRIVQVLDNFDAVCHDLNIGLPKEIELRQKQYEYFREKLLTFVAEGEYTESRVEEWDNSAIIKLLQWVFGPIRVELGSVAEYSQKRISVTDLAPETYVGVDNLLQDRKGKTVATFLPDKGSVTTYNQGDILIGNIRPYLKKIWFSNQVGGTSGDVLTIQNSITPCMENKYLYYILSDDRFFYYNVQYSKGSKMPRGDKKAIMQYKFILPPLSEQERIVSILDKFNILTHSLSEGLPKEIELRQKQYEYWREQLLNFTR